MIPKLGLTRTVVTPAYALISPDGHVPSVLPGWADCTVWILISDEMNACFSQFLITLDEAGRGEGDTADEQWFVYVLAGCAQVNGAELKTGGFAYIPPDTDYDIRGAAAGTRVLIFRKTYEPIEDEEELEFFTGHEDEAEETPFRGDPHARLKTLIPTTLAADMAVNIFTCDPGATLPFVETHVMEHGILFLAGSGVYRLGNDWHPVTAGDALWIAPYCPQWFIAAGPEPARYIYYKDINRLPL